MSNEIREWLRLTASRGSVTLAQAAHMREAADLLAKYETALEQIAAGDKNPMRLALRVLGRPEPGDTDA